MLLFSWQLLFSGWMLGVANVTVIAEHLYMRVKPFFKKLS
jgi:hypothetical protein